MQPAYRNSVNFISVPQDRNWLWTQCEKQSEFYNAIPTNQKFAIWLTMNKVHAKQQQQQRPATSLQSEENNIKKRKSATKEDDTNVDPSDALLTPDVQPQQGVAIPNTHLLLNGGTLRVSDQLMPAFLGAYANAIITKNEVVSVSEQRSPIFRMHWDLDIKDMDEISKDRILDFTRIIQHDCQIGRAHV